MKNRPHQPRLPPRSPFVERDEFNERNNVLYLLLGFISFAERVLSVVPALVEPPKEESVDEAPVRDTPVRILR